MDCFADPSDTGKMGNDITEGKCSWLLAQVSHRMFRCPEPSRPALCCPRSDYMVLLPWHESVHLFYTAQRTYLLPQKYIISTIVFFGGSLKALATASPDTAVDILESYATKGQERRVRDLYLRLGLKEKFRSYERDTRSEIKRYATTSIFAFPMHTSALSDLYVQACLAHVHSGPLRRLSIKDCSHFSMYCLLC